MVEDLSEEDLRNIKEHQALSSPIRYKMFRVIVEGHGKLSLIEIKRKVDCAYQGLLNNIRILKEAGLIDIEKKENTRGRKVYPKQSEYPKQSDERKKRILEFFKEKRLDLIKVNNDITRIKKELKSIKEESNKRIKKLENAKPKEA